MLKFWELEERNVGKTAFLSAKEKYVVELFQCSHSRDKDGRFIVPLLRNQTPNLLVSLGHWLSGDSCLLSDHYN